MDGTYLPFNLGHTCVVFYLVAQPDHPMDSETIYIFRQNHPICNNMEGPGARQRCPGAGFYWLARVNGRPLFSTPSSVMSCWWLEISHIVQRAHWKLWEELEVIRAGRLRKKKNVKGILGRRKNVGKSRLRKVPHFQISHKY
ncbi:uncharacterized protein [Equus asinus]|uniref:uncharacterized protein isoform X7 n=1 Tax=Equus asinus TaxID=9793 RepID=UPI0038F75ABE